MARRANPLSWTPGHPPDSDESRPPKRLAIGAASPVVLALLLWRRLRLSPRRRPIHRRRILMRRSPRCEFPIGRGLILKSFLEGWTASFFGHPVKLGRLFQILSDELHDAIPSHAQFHNSTFKQSKAISVPAGSPHLDAETGEGKMRPGFRKVRCSGFPP
jgi:hypothetical protein